MALTDYYYFRSAVNTYTENGNKNIMDPSKGFSDASKYVAESVEGDRLNIRKGGLIRIPVCGAGEATANLNRGYKYRKDWVNYPCNP